MTDKPTMPSYTGRRDDHIRQLAESTFAAVPEEAREQLKGARATLIDWLTSLGERLQRPAGLIDDNMLDAATAAIEHLAGDDADTAAAKILAVLRGDPEAGRTALRHALGAVLTVCTGPRVLATLSHTMPGEGNLQDEEHGDWMLRHLGAAIDGGTKAFLLRDGDQRVQPYGFIDDELFVPSDALKLLLTRKMYVAVPFPIAPPFKVTQKEAEALVQSGRRVPADLESPLSKAEASTLKGHVAALDVALKQYNNLWGADKTPDDATLKEKTRELTDTILFMSVQVPRIDELARRLVDGDNKTDTLVLEGLAPDKIKSLGYTLSEWVAKKLDEHRLSSAIDGTDLEFVAESVSDSDALWRQLAAAQAQLDKGTVDVEDAVNVLTTAMVTAPALREVMAASLAKVNSGRTETLARVALVELTERLKKLLGVKDVQKKKGGKK